MPGNRVQTASGRICKSEGAEREMSRRVSTYRTLQQGDKDRPQGRVTEVSSVNRLAHHRISNKGRHRNKSNQNEILVQSWARHQAKSPLSRIPFITVSVSPRVLVWRVLEGRSWVCSCEPHWQEDHQDPSQNPSHTQVGLGCPSLQLLCVRCCDE